MAEQIHTFLRACQRLNQDLERTVDSRTAELQHTNRQLKETLNTLQQTHARMMAQERLTGLGELTAGITP